MSHLSLSKQCDRLPQLPQHFPYFRVICGDECRSDFPAQLKLCQQLLLLLPLAAARLGMWCSHGWESGYIRLVARPGCVQH